MMLMQFSFVDNRTEDR